MMEFELQKKNLNEMLLTWIGIRTIMYAYVNFFGKTKLQKNIAKFNKPPFPSLDSTCL